MKLPTKYKKTECNKKFKSLSSLNTHMDHHHSKSGDQGGQNEPDLKSDEMSSTSSILFPTIFHSVAEKIKSESKDSNPERKKYSNRFQVAVILLPRDELSNDKSYLDLAEEFESKTDINLDAIDCMESFEIYSAFDSLLKTIH